MRRRKSLSTIVAEDLAKKIKSGILRPGEQIRTEAELCTKYEVSRTVIREAIARLRSDGLLIPRQGKGVFVSDKPPAQKFEIHQDSLQTLPETIALLELRLCVEVEAAALCAQRRTEREARALRELMERVDAQRNDPETVKIHYDFDFHVAIAKASGNALMHNFLLFLQPILEPRYRLSNLVSKDYKEEYYGTIHREHEEIILGIEEKDSLRAREAMRKHLLASLTRLRTLLQSSGIEGFAAAGSKAPDSLMHGLRSSIVDSLPLPKN